MECPPRTFFAAEFLFPAARMPGSKWNSSVDRGAGRRMRHSMQIGLFLSPSPPRLERFSPPTIT